MGTSIQVRPVSSFEDSPTNGRTLPYLDQVYFDTDDAVMWPGRRAADGNFGASTEKVFLDLTRANDYDLTGSGAATGIQIDNDAGDIAAVVTLDAANSNNVSGLGGGSNYGNLVLQSTVQSSAGFDADIKE